MTATLTRGTAEQSLLARGAVMRAPAQLRLRRVASNFATMDTPFGKLAHALRERRAIIADADSRHDAERHIARLKDVSEKIERLRADLPLPVDPQLAHFLQRASYDKALEFLERP